MILQPPLEKTKTYKEGEDISCLIVGVQNIWSNNSNIIENFQKFPQKKIAVVGCNRTDTSKIGRVRRTVK